jgi:ATP-dependent RNA circularization protein (DNA/RNA ligase family)
MKIKYPRTFHLPWSLSLTCDDKRLKDVSCFEGKEVIVTEKMDGENTSMYRDGIHARSLDGRDHVSRSWVKQLQASIAREIPDGWRICGENLFAKHSLGYDSLRSYFYVFSIWNEKNECLSWDDTVEWCNLLGLETMSVLGRWFLFDEDVIRGISIDPTVSEGYVLRNASSFHFDNFRSNVAKYVRKDHVQTDTHWMLTAIEKNGLKSVTD